MFQSDNLSEKVCESASEHVKEDHCRVKWPQTDHEETGKKLKDFFFQISMWIQVVIVLTIIVLSFRDERIKNHNYNSYKNETDFELM